MVELTRTVRFCLNADGSLASEAPLANSFAAWPPMRGLGRYYELEVTCRGEVDPATGYFMNIKRIDAAVRRRILPLIAEHASSARRSGGEPLGSVLRRIITVLGEELDGAAHAIALKLTPTYTLHLRADDMDHALISQQYEFSAAHRLHSTALSEQENREVFGKCNNPAGHGHNYVLEVVVRCPVGPDGRVLAVEKLDELVDCAVVRKLDHKNLDVDVPEFAGRNSSVEQIAQVIHGLLRDAVSSLDVELEWVRVWETGKTVCTYPA